MRPKRFAIGDMRDRIDIQSKTETVDNAGQPIVSWSTSLAGEPAKYEPINGSEVMRGRQLESNVKVVFTIHYRPGITDDMRVLHNGKYYGILYVHEVDGGRRYLELQCEK